MISLANFEPSELGLPEKFESFRGAQLEAVEQALNDECRFQAMALPTGAGKTLIAMACAKAMGRRVVVLTSTLGLQHQYLKDFSPWLKDIRGKSNYDCEKTGLNCRLGGFAHCPHHKMMNGKPYVSRECPYEDARQIAQRSNACVTNYAYWIRANERGPGLEPPPSKGSNPVELLILDEAHRAVEELGKSLGVQLRESWMKHAKISFKRHDEIKYWSEWAAENYIGVESLHEIAKEEYRQHRTLNNRDRLVELDQFKEALTKLHDVGKDSWVCEMHEGKFGRTWDFDPIWPAQFAEYRLFCGVPKVILMSATLRPMAMGMLGVKKELYTFREWPRVFPAQNTPIYSIPAFTDDGKAIRLNHKITTENLDKWVERIDEIIGSRLDRKGLIHTVSYQRQQYLLTHSKYAYLMVVNSNQPDSESSAEVMERFKAMDAPAVLVSPSFSTGWDFPGATCEYQIIAKLAFPDTRSKLMAARLERNPKYGDYLTMQDFIQACGRGSRFEDDMCEVFIVDASIDWFFYHNRALAPRDFEIQRIRQVPPAPPRMAA